jgi:hypothetical protein
VTRIGEEVLFIGRILNNEYVDRDRRPFLEIIKERLTLFCKLGELKWNPADESVGLLNKNIVPKASLSQNSFGSSRDFSTCAFLSNLVAYLLDTYAIVMMAAMSMCDGNYTLKEERIVEEMHYAIINLYEEGNIPDIHSCLKEPIKNAFGQLVHLGLLEKQVFLNQNGSQIVYLSCPFERKEQVQEHFTRMTSNMPHANDALIEAWGDHILKAIENANIVHMSAKL